MIPGGKIDTNEFPYDAAKREFTEETSFIIDNDKINDITFYRYKCKKGESTMIYIIFSCQHFPAFDINKTNKETSAVAYEKLKDIYTFFITDTTTSNPIL